MEEDICKSCIIVYTRENQTLQPRGKLCADVQGGTVHNRQEVETTQVPITWWMDKQNLAFPDRVILFCSRKEWHYAERSQTQGATCCMNPGPRNEWMSKSVETGSRWGVASGWGRRGGSRDVRANGDEVCLRSDENVLQLDSGDSYATLWTC